MATSLRVRDLIVGANNAVIKWANIKRGDQVLIITDTTVDTQLIEALASVATLQGAKVVVNIMERFSLPHQELPEPLVAAMEKVDLALYCMENMPAHTAASLRAQEHGTKVLGMGAAMETMATEAARFPPEIIFAMATEIAEQWKAGKTIRVTDDKGTDLRAKINPDHVIGREGAGAPMGTRLVEGKPRRSRIGFWEGGFGTVGYWPEWTAEGVVLFDAMQGFAGRLKTPLKLTVEAGKVVKYEGDQPQIDYVDEMVKRFGPDTLHLAEIMIGLNPKVDIALGLHDTQHLHAHRAAGTCHVAMGNSVDDFRTVKPGVHHDSLLITPTVMIDDQKCVDRGRLCILDTPEIKKMLDEYGLTV